MTDRACPVLYVAVVDGAGNKQRIIDQTSRIRSLDYLDSDSKADTCSLTVDNYDLSNFDSPLWAHNNRLQVTWGYAGNLAVARELIITKVTGFTELKVTAKARSVLLDAVKKSRTFRNMTRAEVVRQIATEYGYEGEALVIDDSGAKFPHITQAGISDAQLIRKLAHQQGWEFYVDPAGFHFHEARVGQEPVRTFEWFTDPGRGDLLKVSVETDITRKPTAVKVKARDPIEKKTEEAKASNSTDTNREGLARIQLVPEADLSDGAFISVLPKAAPVAAPMMSTTAAAEEAYLASQVGKAELARQATLPASDEPTETMSVPPPEPYLSNDALTRYTQLYMAEQGVSLVPVPAPRAADASSAESDEDALVQAENDKAIAYYRNLLRTQEAQARPLSPDDPSLQGDAPLAPRQPHVAFSPDDPGLQGAGYGTVYAPATQGAAGAAPAGGAKAAEDEAKGKFRKAQRTAVKIELEAIGDPAMNAKTVIFLAGAGRRLTGNYYVKEVAHSVKPGSYTMKLKIASDGVADKAAQLTASHAKNGLPDVAGPPSKAKVVTLDPAKKDWNTASLIAGKKVEPDALVPVAIYDKAGRQIGTTWRVRGEAEPAVTNTAPKARKFKMDAAGNITEEEASDAPA
jgi:phage protein D